MKATHTNTLVCLGLDGTISCVFAQPSTCDVNVACSEEVKHLKNNSELSVRAASSIEQALATPRVCQILTASDNSPYNVIRVLRLFRSNLMWILLTGLEAVISYVQRLSSVGLVV